VVCPYCGSIVDKIIKKRKGTYCINCIHVAYVSCSKCDKAILKQFIRFGRTHIQQESLQYQPLIREFLSKRYLGGGFCKQCWEVIILEVKSSSCNTCEICKNKTLNGKHKGSGKVLCTNCVELAYTCKTCKGTYFSDNEEHPDRDIWRSSVNYSIRNDGRHQVCEQCNSALWRGGEINRFRLCRCCEYLTTQHSPEPTICNHCYQGGSRWCKNCNNFYNTYLGEPSDGGCCKSCAQDRDLLNFKPALCGKCKAPIINHVFPSSRFREKLCRFCIGKVIVSSNIIPQEGNIPFEPYNYKPLKFYKHGKPGKDTLIIGTEHEVYFDCQESRNKVLKRLYRKYKEDICYVSFDGSIGGRQGIEVVTHPMTFKFIKDLSLPKDLPYNKIRDNSCGMHVHLSKNFFDHLTLYKLMRFIYDHDSFISFVSERNPTRYCQKLPDRGYITRFAKQKSNVRGIDKHTQVNLRHNNTVELRIFAQATDPCNWRKNVEFSALLAHFCKDKSFKRINLKEFFDYLGGNSRYYPNIYKHLSGTSPEDYKVVKRKKKSLGEYTMDARGPIPVPERTAPQRAVRQERGRELSLNEFNIFEDYITPPTPPADTHFTPATPERVASPTDIAWDNTMTRLRRE
jgi:hypothetical protein